MTIRCLAKLTVFIMMIAWPMHQSNQWFLALIRSGRRWQLWLRWKFRAL